MKKTVKETLRVPPVPSEVPTKEVMFETSGGAYVRAERSGDDDFLIKMTLRDGSPIDGWYFSLESLQELQRFLHELEDELVAFPKAVTDDAAIRAGY